MINHSANYQNGRTLSVFLETGGDLEECSYHHTNPLQTSPWNPVEAPVPHGPEGDISAMITGLSPDSVSDDPAKAVSLYPEDREPVVDAVLDDDPGEYPVSLVESHHTVETMHDHRQVPPGSTSTALKLAPREFGASITRASDHHREIAIGRRKPKSKLNSDAKSRFRGVRRIKSCWYCYFNKIGVGSS